MREITVVDYDKEVVDMIEKYQKKLPNEKLREKIHNHGKSVDFIPFNKDKEGEV